MNAARANAGFPTWWTSTDGGAHWDAGRDYDSSGAMTGDADAAFGTDGYLYALNLAFNNPPDQPMNPTVLVYSSPDQQRWSGPANFPPPHGADQPDRPWLVPEPGNPGQVLVTNSEGAGDIVAWQSMDHAQSFSGPMPVTDISHGASLELTARPVFDPTQRGRVFMVYEASPLGSPGPPKPTQPLADFPLTQLWLAESNDSGRTWTNSPMLDIANAFGPGARGGSIGHVLPAFTIDPSGTLYSAFSARLGGDTQTHIFLVHSTDHGRHWSAPSQVDTEPTNSNVMPAIAAGPDGRVDVSWYASSALSFTDQNATWVEIFGQSMNALSARPTFSTAEIGGTTHVGSIDATGNPGSTFYNWGLRDFQSLAVDPCGMAHLAWTDDTGPGATVTARQTSGPSVTPNHPSNSRCF